MTAQPKPIVQLQKQPQISTIAQMPRFLQDILMIQPQATIPILALQMILKAMKILLQPLLTTTIAQLKHIGLKQW
jgi:hypothetical protein